jgi:hypothetical protein
MRNLLMAGTSGLFLALGTVFAIAAAPDSTHQRQPEPRGIIEGRAAYENPASPYGRLGNDFGPGFNYGAPASARDFGGTEITRDR